MTMAYSHLDKPVRTLSDLSAWPPTAQTQVGGDHYLGKPMQPWDIIEAWDLDFWEGNCLKYLLRRKPGTDRVTDLQKAQHYLAKCIARAEAPTDGAEYLGCTEAREKRRACYDGRCAVRETCQLWTRRDEDGCAVKCMTWRAHWRCFDSPCDYHLPAETP